jgi:hypothetical protein
VWVHDAENAARRGKPPGVAGGSLRLRGSIALHSLAGSLLGLFPIFCIDLSAGVGQTARIYQWRFMRPLKFTAVLLVSMFSLLGSRADASFSTQNHEESFKMLDFSFEATGQSYIFSFNLTEPLDPTADAFGNALGISLYAYEVADRKTQYVTWVDYDPSVDPPALPFYDGFNADFTGPGPILGYVPFTQPTPTSYVFTFDSDLVAKSADGDIYYQAQITTDGRLTDFRDGTTFAVPLPPAAWAGAASMLALCILRRQLTASIVSE